MEETIFVIGRVLFASFFLINGIDMLKNYSATAGYMKAFSIPERLLPIVILFLMVSSVLLIINWNTLWVCAALALFCIVSACTFHRNWTELSERVSFTRNISFVGALLVLAIQG